MATTVVLLIVFACLGVLIARAAYIAYPLVRRWLGVKPKPRPAANRCRCGYEMDQLDTIRCPECGRVIGFDATAEDLELTDDQIRRAKAKRDARQAVTKKDA